MADTKRVLAIVAAIVSLAGAAAAAPRDTAGLHIPNTKRVNFTWQTNDGAGYRWDVQYYGSIGNGTNNAYSGGVYCQVWGSNVTGRGVGWINDAGDEIEIGPYQRNNLKCYRRVKIYRDRGLARWLDIFENSGSTDITVPVVIYICSNYTVQRTITSSGGNAFSDKDWGFLTQTSAANSPAVLHLVSGKNAPVRPTVQIQNNRIYVRYNVPVPAGKTAVLCYFESQNNSPADLTKVMKQFRPYKVMRDVPASVRKLIVNWRMSGGPDNIDLDRSDSADAIIEANDDRKFGTITNESFVIRAFFGNVQLKAEQVVGMVRDRGDSARLRVALVNGQIVCGTAGETVVTLALSAGGTLKVPMSRIRQWSYRISRQRPESVPFRDPVAVLRTGDRLAFDAGALELKFRTRYGVVDLRPADLLNITMDNADNAIHQVTFRNGSRLGGFLEPATLNLSLKIGSALQLDRNLVSQLLFGDAEQDSPLLTRMLLSNGDELLGKIDLDKLTVRTEYGTVLVSPTNLKSVTFSKTHLGWGRLVLWDGSMLRGELQEAYLPIRVRPGPVLKIHVGHIVGVVRPQALPPEEIIRNVEKHIARLGTESYKDRQAAREALVKLGKGILPLLRGKYAGQTDPEVRQAIEEIIEKLGGGTTAPVIAPPQVGMPIFMK